MDISKKYTLKGKEFTSLQKKDHILQRRSREKKYKKKGMEMVIREIFQKTTLIIRVNFDLFKIVPSTSDRSSFVKLTFYLLSTFCRNEKKKLLTFPSHPSTRKWKRFSRKINPSFYYKNGRVVKYEKKIVSSLFKTTLSFVLPFLFSPSVLLGSLPPSGSLFPGPRPPRFHPPPYLPRDSRNCTFIKSPHLRS